jgi:Holliday junction DNA helicase RuvA
MIAYLAGEILIKQFDYLILKNSGVGYKIYSTESELSRLSLGDEVAFWIFENIKEDRYDLFGFTDQSSLRMFETILGVNGAGPKAALAILSIGTIPDLKEALLTSNAKYIQQASGVGKKLAERLILELSGRLSETALDNSSSTKLNEEDEAHQALVSLGYSTKDAAKALEKVDKNLSLEDRIKQALRG